MAMQFFISIHYNPDDHLLYSYHDEFSKRQNRWLNNSGYFEKLV